MELCDSKKKQEGEVIRAKLDMTKNQLMDTLRTISKTQEEQQELQCQQSRKSKDLKITIGSQDLKISNLNKNIEEKRVTLQSRVERHKELMKANAELKEELAASDYKEMETEFQRKLVLLEEKVKESYMQLQKVKDAELLIDLSPDGPDEQRIPYVEEMLKERKLKEEEAAEEFEELNEVLKRLDNQVELKAEKLAKLNDKHATLSRRYALLKTPEEDPEVYPI